MAISLTPPKNYRVLSILVSYMTLAAWVGNLAVFLFIRDENPLLIHEGGLASLQCLTSIALKSTR